MLAEKLANLNLNDVLLTRDEYRPFEQAGERAYWSGLTKELRTHLISAGEMYLGYDWPALPATLYLEYTRTGNRADYETRCFTRRAALGALALAECAEGRGRFLDDIANGVWCICEESSWCVPAHENVALPDIRNPEIDLFAAETASMLAWVYYLLKTRLDDISPALCARIALETDRRVLTPYLKRDDFSWMGFARPGGPVNNWNPWCNSNCLAVSLLLEEDGGKRRAAVEKCARSLDVFLAAYPQDGGCDEGTSYWSVAGGALFDCLEQLFGATGGALDVYGETLIANIGRFIYRSHIAGEYYINFADGGARERIPSELVWRYGVRTGDDKLTAQGAAAYRLGGLEPASPSVYGSLFRPLWGIRSHEALSRIHIAPPLVRDTWLEGIEVMAAREKPGSAQGLYLAAKGGHNNESHNHNDVGSFVAYSEGLPVIIDVGVETYTAKTFSPDRYSIWTMQSQYHNLPMVGGVQQMNGPQYRAKDTRYSCSDAEAALESDIADTYPAEAGIALWKRSFRFHRQGDAFIEISDEYQLKNEPAALTFSLMTCREHEIDTGSIKFAVPGGRDLILTFNTEAYGATSERIDIKDETLSPVWGDHIYRILLTAKAPGKSGKAVIQLRQV